MCAYRIFSLAVKFPSWNFHCVYTYCCDLDIKAWLFFVIVLTSKAAICVTERNKPSYHFDIYKTTYIHRKSWKGGSHHYCFDFFLMKGKQRQPPSWVLGIINISRSQITNQQLSLSCCLLRAMVCFYRTPEDLKYRLVRRQHSVLSIIPKNIINW